MSIHRQFATLFAIALPILAACTDTPFEPEPAANGAPAVAVKPDSTPLATLNAANIIEDEFYDLTGSTTVFTCDDGRESEEIRLEGGVRYRSWFIALPNSAGVYISRRWPAGLRGIGLTTGDDYRVIERELQWSFQKDAALVGGERETWSLRNRKTGQLFQLSYRLFYRFDAEGNLVKERQLERTTCK
jgi:hypothetical protein